VDGLDHLVRELVALQVGDLFRRVLFMDGLGDGEEQMALAEAGVAVDKEGVINLAGVFRNCHGGGVSKFVRSADNEVIEGIAVRFRQKILRFPAVFILSSSSPASTIRSKSQEKRSDRVLRIVSPKRERMMRRLKSVPVWSTSRQSSSSMGTQSENQVFTAVGVRSAERTDMTLSQISFNEFIAFPPYIEGTFN
jgi:hypothetical protein